MKAYKLIFELLKHPFAKVVTSSKYEITHTRYNRYCEEYTLDSITHVVNQTISNETYKSEHNYTQQ